MRMVTVSPASLAMALRTSALIGSLWVPSPRAMKELRNGRPSTVPLTLTRPRVPKNSAEPGMTTYVQPPLAGLFWSVAVNCLSMVLMPLRRGGDHRLIGGLGREEAGDAKAHRTDHRRGPDAGEQRLPHGPFVADQHVESDVR